MSTSKQRHGSRRKKARSAVIIPAQATNAPQQQPNPGSGFGNALAVGFGVGVGEAAGEDLFDSLFGGRRRRVRKTRRRSRRILKKRSRR